MKLMNSDTHSCTVSFASFEILAFAGNAFFIIRLTFAIGRNLSCSLVDPSLFPALCPPDSLSESAIASYVIIFHQKSRKGYSIKAPFVAGELEMDFLAETINGVSIIRREFKGKMDFSARTLTKKGIIYKQMGELCLVKTRRTQKKNQNPLSAGELEIVFGRKYYLGLDFPARI